MANLKVYGELHMGSQDVLYAYLGEECVYEFRHLTHDYSNSYLTFEILTSGYIAWGLNSPSYQDPYTIQYSINGGTWTTINPSINDATAGSYIALFSVSAGDIVRFKHYTGVTHYGTEVTYGGGYSWDTYNHGYHTFGANFGATGPLYNKTGATFNVYGNIMSLFYDDFIGQTTFPSWSEGGSTSNATHAMGLFRGCKGLISAEGLVLPATTVSYGCYADMFYECINMTTPPQELPGDINYHSYDMMFNGCTSLTRTPIIRATALTYGSGFTPSTSPHSGDNNYAGCRMMFQGCTSLNQATCLTTTYDYDTFSGWLYNVSSSGTFYKNSSTTWNTGINGIPNGWTTQNYTE